MDIDDIKSIVSSVEDMGSRVVTLWEELEDKDSEIDALSDRVSELEDTIFDYEEILHDRKKLIEHLGAMQ